MQFPLELEVQVVASAQSSYTIEQVEQRLAMLANRDDAQAEREYLMALLNREQARMEPP
jgi:hypothetical protein